MSGEITAIVDEVFPAANPRAVEPYDGGETHEVARVEFAEREPVVVKYTTDGPARLRRDRATLQYVGEKTPVPVPSVLGFGEEPVFVVIEELPGETTPQLREFDGTDAAEYLRTAGRLLATLHEEATFDSPGRIHGTKDGELEHEPAASWPALYCELKTATADELADTRFEGIATAAIDVIDDVTEGFTVETPVLAHCDFGPNNVFRKDGDVTGVIDWEWCLAGDPAYDLLRAERLFRREADDGTRATLLDGYTAVRPIPDGYEQRARTYAAYETLAAMSSFESWRPDDEETAAKMADRLREAVTEGLPIE